MLLKEANMSNHYWSTEHHIAAFIFICVILTTFILGGGIFGFISIKNSYKNTYERGYKQGQVDYQKGIIKYKVTEVTTDIIEEINN
jgi:hypothetical protein